MSVVSVATAESTASVPLRAPRTIRVGLLGLGNVGQAVARSIEATAQVVRERGLTLRVDAALVRDPLRSRRCPRVPRITSNPEAFLRGRYDVVIEAMGGTEPARTLVARLLGRGVAVVSANKALLAEHGESLQRIARRRAAPFRYEAAAIAGVPFIGTFTRRPLVASLSSLTGIVNGTSNYVLTSIDRGDAASVAEAVERAQALGYAEPDASFDVSGRDALDKLILLLRECAGVVVNRRAIEVAGIDALTAADLDAAHRHGGTVKPLVHADIGDMVDAWVGPAFVPAGHPLATVDGALNGIRLASRYVPDLFFSGPGAGPDVTAATLLDDAIETVSASPALRTAAALHGNAASDYRLASVSATPPSSRWFVRSGGSWTLTEPLDRAALEREFASDAFAIRAVCS
jgi:homoserine dehydrogenase